jgi:DNA invertase Pin-like site-specific DNA recombinase
MLIGYVRVSTFEQSLDLQTDTLVTERGQVTERRRT